MKIIITGGAGFIGSNLVRYLAGGGHTICVIDDFNDYYDPELKRSNLFGLPVRLVEADIRDLKKCDDAFAEFLPDIVVHLAARAGVRPSLQDPKLYASTNINGTLNLLDLVRKYGVARFVFASSSSVYGNISQGPCSEDRPIAEAQSPYAVTKLAGEQFCRVYANCFGLNLIALRFFTVYGPRQRPDLAIAKFCRCIEAGIPIDLYEPKSARDYTYIDDIISGVVAAINYSKPGFSVFNLGSDRPIGLMDLVAKLETALGKTAKTRLVGKQLGDVNRTWANIDRAAKELNYAPKTTLDDGLDLYVRWFRGHP